jgi:tRNA (pseudouridine54-N1)-methyltransferase
MRAFILFAGKAVTSPDFHLNDLPGSGGRMDLVARCITQAIWLSDEIRKNVAIYCVLNGPPNPPKTIGFFSDKLKRVSPDERNIASWIKKALEYITVRKDKSMEKEETEEWKGIQEGIFISNKDLISLVEELKNSCGFELYLLHKDGEDIRKVRISDESCFILGDHIGLPKELEKELEKLGITKISIGPKMYLASTCIAVVNNELDKRGID